MSHLKTVTANFYFCTLFYTSVTAFKHYTAYQFYF